MIRIHKEHRVLTYGSLKFLYEEHNILCYGRFDREEQVIVLLNNREGREVVDIPVWEIGVGACSVARRLMMSWEESFSLEEIEYYAVGGKMRISIPGECGMVLCCKADGRP